MSSSITDEAKAEYLEAFNIFDKDRSGSIDASEFGLVMKQLGHNPSEAELKEMIAEIDIDNDGQIDFDEFLAS